jgi:type II secretory pathway component PulJ
MKLNKNNLNKKALTLIELIITVMISATILIFLTSFIADTFNEISYSNKKTPLLTKLYEIENKFKTVKQQYLS